MTVIVTMGHSVYPINLSAEVKPEVGLSLLWSAKYDGPAGIYIEAEGSNMEEALQKVMRRLADEEYYYTVRQK